MQRRVKKNYQKLSALCCKLHILSSSGEVSKPLIIGLIAIFSILALSLLLFFSDRFVGKAVYTGDVNNAGGVFEPGVVYVDQPFSLTFGANVGNNVVDRVVMKLNLPKGIDCSNIKGFQNMLPWTVPIYGGTSCNAVDKTITYAYNRDYPTQPGISGSFDFAKIDFINVPAGIYSFSSLQWGIAYVHTFDEQGNIIGSEQVVNAWGNPQITVLQSVCGDGKIEGVEECDGFNFAGKSCLTQGNYVGGQLVCTDACKIDVSQCVVAQEKCGNFVIDIGTEKCDNSATPKILEGISCSTEGNFVGGALSCNADCTLNTAQCTVCNPEESVCADATSYKQCKVDGSGYDVPVACTADEQCNGGVCVALVQPPAPAVCGNNKLEAGEECDDGNLVDGDGCSSACQGEIQQQQVPACGNGLVEDPEVCDDGNNNDGDGCTFDCLSFEAGWICDTKVVPTKCTEQVQTVCGNGLVEGTEECDGANLVGQSCTDKGFASGVLSCSNVCTFDTSGCSAAKCGDNIIQANLGEQCDDGNIVDGDGCSSACQIEIQQQQVQEDPFCINIKDKLKDKPVADKSLVDGMAGALEKATKLQKIAAMVNAIKAWLAAQPQQ